jgi:hypothetical protein
MSQRAAVVAVVTVVVALLSVTPANAADPHAGGTRTEVGGTVVVSVPGSTGTPGLPTSGTSSTSGSGSTTPIVCSYYADGNPDTGDLPLVDTSTLKTGDWVWVACYDPGSGNPVGQAQRVQWNIGAPPALQPTAANLAQNALNRLAVPLRHHGHRARLRATRPSTLSFAGDGGSASSRAASERRSIRRPQWRRPPFVGRAAFVFAAGELAANYGATLLAWGPFSPGSSA